MADYSKVVISRKELNDICEASKKLLRKVGHHKQEAHLIYRISKANLQMDDPQGQE